MITFQKIVTLLSLCLTGARLVASIENQIVHNEKIREQQENARSDNRILVQQKHKQREEQRRVHENVLRSSSGPGKSFTKDTFEHRHLTTHNSIADTEGY